MSDMTHPIRSTHPTNPTDPTDKSPWVSGAGRQDEGVVPVQVFGLVLAAGQSTRMGQQKLLLPVEGETTLIRHVLTKASEANLDGLLVVVNSHDERLRQETADGPWQQIVNPHAKEGMSTSLRCGIEMMERSLADGVLVLLGDMPDITVSTLNRVADRFRMEYGADDQGYERDAAGDQGHERDAAGDQGAHDGYAGDRGADDRIRPLIVQASYRGVPSHPVVFSRSLFGELVAVQGDEGARAVIKKYRAHRVLIDVDENVPVDLDTPEAYEEWRGRNDQSV